jgi:hypothetical protein
MGLNITQLVELAVLTVIHRVPAPLTEIIRADADWHELAGRGDIRRQMSTILRRLLDEGDIEVTETAEDGISEVKLVGVEAQMALERAAAGLKPNQESADDVSVMVQITEIGRGHYKRLAGDYYNA